MTLRIDPAIIAPQPFHLNPHLILMACRLFIVGKKLSQVLIRGRLWEAMSFLIPDP